MPGPYTPVLPFLPGLVTSAKLSTVKDAIAELQAGQGRIGATVYKAAKSISGGGTNVDIDTWDLVHVNTVNYGGINLANSTKPMTIQAGYGGLWLIQLAGNLSVSPITSGWPVIRDLPSDQFVSTPGIQPGPPMTPATLPYFGMLIEARLPDGAAPVACINQTSGGAKAAQAWFSMFRVGD